MPSEFRIYTKRIERCGECPYYNHRLIEVCKATNLETSHDSEPPSWCPLPKGAADAR